MLRLSVVSVSVPPTLEAANDVALAFVRLAVLPVPFVDSVTAPVNAFACVNPIVALAAEVVNDEVPVTVRAPV